MSMYPFIQAEKAGQRSVNRACAVMKVSRAAHYEWCQQQPSRRAQADRELSEKVKAVFDGSRQTYGVGQREANARLARRSIQGAAAVCAEAAAGTSRSALSGLSAVGSTQSAMIVVATRSVGRRPIACPSSPPAKAPATMAA